VLAGTPALLPHQAAAGKLLRSLQFRPQRWR